MHDNLTELPEAIPLHRVSPAWRVLAILAVIILLLALIGIVAMSVQIHVLQMQQVNRPINWTAPPMPPPAPAVVVPVVNAPADKTPIDPTNLPYPTREDLRQSLGFETEPAEQGPTLRERFLRLGKDLWKGGADSPVRTIAVSQDGVSIAFVQRGKLLFGPYNNLREIDDAVNPSGPRPPPARKEPIGRAAGIPAWSSDSRYVCFATVGGRLLRFDVQRQQLETLPAHGEGVAPVPNDPNHVVTVYAVRTAKLEAPGLPVEADRNNIGVCDLRTKKLVVLRNLPNYLRFPVVSPDGKQVAMWASGSPTADLPSDRFHLIRVSLEGGLLETIPLNAREPGPICWTPDGKSLIYERRLEPPLPLDCLADRPLPVPAAHANLFEYNLEKKEEARLTRGGGFASPSIDSQGHLYYLTWEAKTDWGRPSPRLKQVTLDQVRDFIGKQPELPRRDVAGWTAVITQAADDAQVPSELAKFTPSPEKMAKLAGAFALRYQERFGQKPPADVRGLDSQIKELRGLDLPMTVRTRLALILAATHGEYLREKHDAVWQLAGGPVVLERRETEPENPFARTVNLFAFAGRAAGVAPDSTGPASLDSLLRQGEGRTLLLTNDPAAAQARLAEFIDPDLDGGIKLLQANKAKEAVKLLNTMLRKPDHQRNGHLALLVGQLFYQHRQLDAVVDLMDRVSEQAPADARKFNLLGVAMMERDSAPNARSPIDAFKKALRCDLHFGPAYLNLARAYEIAGDPPSAIGCLKRYLELLPNGPLAADAARRLAELEEDPKK